jgi:hypothetical protein
VDAHLEGTYYPLEIARREVCPAIDNSVATKEQIRTSPAYFFGASFFGASFTS